MIGQIDMEHPRDLWTPLCSRIIMNPKGRHYHKMKNAVWLLLYLAMNAEPKTGRLRRNIDTISSDMGITRSTIQRWLKMLRSNGYLETENTGRFLAVQIKNWNESAPTPNLAHQMFQKCHTRSAKNETTHNPKIIEKKPNLKQKMTTHKHTKKASPIDISINNKLNIDIDKEDSLPPSSTRNPAARYGARSKEELLALDLATALDDFGGLRLYLSYARKYPEQLLRRVLGVVMEIPPEKVKRSRGALFNYLVQKYGNQNKHNSGD